MVYCDPNIYFTAVSGVVSFMLFLLQPVLEHGDLFLIFEVRRLSQIQQ